MLVTELEKTAFETAVAEKRLVGIVTIGDFAVESSEFEVVGETLSEISEPA